MPDGAAAARHWFGVPDASASQPASTPDDRMQLAAEHLRSQMPDVSAHVFPAHWLVRALSMGNPAVQAMALMFGQVAYDPALIPENQSDVDDVLAHELTHVRQGQQRSWFDAARDLFSDPGPYLERPNEIEAYAEEAHRRTARQDVPLPRN